MFYYGQLRGDAEEREEGERGGGGERQGSKANEMNGNLFIYCVHNIFHHLFILL